MLKFSIKQCSVILLGYLFTTLCLATSSENLATDNYIIEISNNSEPINVGSVVDIYEDSTGELTLSEIQSTASKAWFNSTLGTPNFSYTSSVYWFKGYIKNTDFRRLNGLIEIANPLLNDIEYYFIIDNEVSHYYLSGSQYPFDGRFLPHRNFLFPFNLNENETGIFYIRVKSKGSLQVPIFASPDFKFFEYDQVDLSGKSAFYGIMLTIILFNLFLYFSLRERVYIFYVLFP